MTYTIIYKWDDKSDVWFVSIPEIKGCHTQGKTIPEARKRIHEALLSIDDVHPNTAFNEKVIPE